MRHPEDVHRVFHALHVEVDLGEVGVGGPGGELQTEVLARLQVAVVVFVGDHEVLATLKNSLHNGLVHLVG